ncbi:MAG: DUF5916 domain-containing protein [Bacteroidota bacterium]
MRNRFLILGLFFSLLPSWVFSQTSDSISVPQHAATRISIAPKIDGKSGDAAWLSVPEITNFTQFVPNNGAPASQRSSVRVAYDNDALYVLAELFDSAPDSILKEFGLRDNSNVNADYFRVAMDPYGKHQENYVFGVTAAGVQFDEKYFDETFDAVWESAVGFDANGWCVEFRIPYSAFRFPAMDEQQWSFQLNRSIRRNREFTMWAPVPPEASNPMVYWGHLTNLKNIDPPLRLSLTPYVSAYAESVPFVSDANGTIDYQRGFSYNAGADVKYGVDERFTIDMTLLPDFGQVQSDNKVKNLSYQESTYDENRSFFKEGADLFNRNNLFYTRRIGKTPSGFFSAEGSLLDGEELVENPSTVKLLNATRFTGRTGNGLGIGIFNAITDNMYAIAKRPDGSTRKILTEPLTNYSALVLDQDLKNNSEIYLINTNVIREGRYTDANVTNTGFTISNKKNTFSIGADAGMSYRTNLIDDTGALKNETGYAYRVFANKQGGGRFGYGFSRLVFDNRYQSIDMGYQTINQTASNEFQVSYNIYEPVGIIRSSYTNLNYDLNTLYGTGRLVDNMINVFNFTTFKSYFTMFGGLSYTPGDFYDYFEPRVPGRFQKGFRFAGGSIGLSTDYRKTLAVDQNFSGGTRTELYQGINLSSSTTFRLRLSDRANLKLKIYVDSDPKNVGFSDIDNNGDIIYGIRNLSTQSVQLTGTYAFSKDMVLSLNARHYRAYAKHDGYAVLMADGSLQETQEYPNNNNFDYNIFNVDVVYSWMFAPGSTLSVVYKNIIENELMSITVFKPYGSNFERIINDPQTNSISLKMVYYLDYQQLRRKNRKQ